MGRALGAAVTAKDTVLFVDGDMALPAEDLGAFLVAIEQGSDVALNDITPFLPSFMKQDSVTYSKMFRITSYNVCYTKLLRIDALPKTSSGKVQRTLLGKN